MKNRCHRYSLDKRTMLVTMFAAAVQLLARSSSVVARSSRTPVAFATTLQRTNELVGSMIPTTHEKMKYGRTTTTTTQSPFSSIRLFSSLRDQDDLLSQTGYRRPVVQWYPGHIAKAEKQLAETLKAVDVVVEVRDARACKATAHPRVGEWCAGRPRIVVLTHSDMIPKSAETAWRRAYETFGAERWDIAPINGQVVNQAQQARDLRSKYEDNKKSSQVENTTGRNPGASVTPVEQVLFVNAKQGQGIHTLNRSIFKAGAHVQERRARRGLNPRPLRVGIIGYPNVGKSALINRLLGRVRAKSSNTPGVTRSLQWIRVRSDESKATLGKEFELLDSPGIIPAKMVDQSDALLLAACNCIGQAAYDNQAVAAYLCDWLMAIHFINKQATTCPDWRRSCKERYGFDPLVKTEGTGDYMTGEDMLFRVAENTCCGDPEDASRKILQDFRSGRMGLIALQLAPETEKDNGQLEMKFGDEYERQQGNQDRANERKKAQEERSQHAIETAKERGLELPPIVETGVVNNKDDVGKGMFDGW